MGERCINLYAILARREAQIDTVDPSDMDLALAPEPAGAGLPEGALPYCLDMARERVLFTVHDAAGLARVRSAAFMFNDQLATALSAASVPFERMDEAFAPTAAPPVFVFSPGRTGSTLLVRLLEAAGLACASEPDVLTQAVCLPKADFALLPPAMRGRLAAGCVAALGLTLGAGLHIKLRSQCNARPLLLTDAAPGCRVVFMLRGVAAWALSRHRSFLEPPETVAGILREAMDALDKLAFSGAPFDLLWFETLCHDPKAALRICAPGATLDAARLAAVMAADSQEGTAVARALVANTPAQEGFLAAFGRAWAEARAGAEWHPATEATLAEMWRR